MVVIYGFLILYTFNERAILVIMICVNGKKNLMLLLDYLRMFERACFDRLNMTNAKLNMTNHKPIIIFISIDSMLCIKRNVSLSLSKAVRDNNYDIRFPWFRRLSCKKERIKKASFARGFFGYAFGKEN